MKRRLAFLLTMVFIVTCLSACSKSKVAKEVESLINQIGEISLDSQSKIIEAEEYYAALTENQKDEVENYKKLLDARKEYESLIEAEEAKQIISQLEKQIDNLISQPCRKQSDINEFEVLYNSLDEKYHSQIKNGDKVNEVFELTKYEQYALSAANEIKDSLKSSDSFKLKEATVVVCKKGGVSPYYVSVRYSGTNSFGGVRDKSSFVDIGEDGESTWWSMSALLGGLEENELLLYSDSLKHKEKEYEIDVERIADKLD